MGKKEEADYSIGRMGDRLATADAGPGQPPSAVAAPALRADGVDKRYGARRALSEVSLEVAPGAAVGLVGANGAGKTTFLKCALDLCAFESGRIEIFGVDRRQPAARSRLAYVPERFNPPYYLLGREFLAMALALGGARYDADRARAMAQALELDPEALGRPARQLSKGMLQKLGLAACLLLERDLYVLDEPMSGLDPASRLAVKSALAGLQRAGRALFFTSHVLSDVEELCSALVVLDGGRVRFAGAPAELRARTGENHLERAFLRIIRDHGDAPAIGA